MTDCDPITCHVLNTLTGTPASGLPCTLTLLSAPSLFSSAPAASANSLPTFYATTDGDGRVKAWSPSSSSIASIRALLAMFPPPSATNSCLQSTWSLRFNVGPWYAERGVESFWPSVEVQFVVRGREGEDGWRHYHVPVLLGPWSYSTYRGS